MAGRRALSSVAHGITNSFMSRNNDLNGYWAIGQLLSHALATDTPSLIIDLKLGTSAPAPSKTALSSLPARWSEVFWSRIDRQGLARATVDRAELSVGGDLAGGRTRGRRTEYLVQCRTTITDDHGRAYSARSEVWCFPHDPAFELRSTRGA
jgi:hypothetical protein